MEQRSNTNRQGDKQCYQCGQYGHLMYNYLKREESNEKGVSKPTMMTYTGIPWNADSQKHLKYRQLNGSKVRVLIDTGSEGTPVAAHLLRGEQSLGRGSLPIQCVHGDTVHYPRAKVRLTIGRLDEEVEVVAVPRLPVAVLLGRDLLVYTGIVPEYQSLVVMTHSKSKMAPSEQEAEDGQGDTLVPESTQATGGFGEGTPDDVALVPELGGVGDAVTEPKENEGLYFPR